MSKPRVDRALLSKAALGLLGIVTLAAVAGVVLRGPIEAMSAVFLARFGLAGLAAGVIFCDASPFPLTHEPVLLLAVAGGIDTATIAVVASLASVSAGPIGFLGGRLLARTRGARAFLEARSPQMVAFLQEWGATGVAIAALLPIPFAVATWTAGLMAVPFPKVLAASTLRIPKTCFYLWLIVQGWSVGGAV